MSAETILCVRCARVPADGICCSSHGKSLCHGCYRRTHFVEVCSPSCVACAREGLPTLLPSSPTGGSSEQEVETS